MMKLLLIVSLFTTVSFGGDFITLDSLQEDCSEYAIKRSSQRFQSSAAAFGSYRYRKSSSYNWPTYKSSPVAETGTTDEDYISSYTTVKGHWRTSKNGKSYYVRSHSRRRR